MRSVRSLWAISTLIILSATCSRADSLRLSMDEVVARAIAANLELRASRKDISVAEANLERARPLLPSNPSFSMGAHSMSGFAPNYSFSLSQEFEIAGQRGARINATQQEVEKATWDGKTAERTLVATAKKAFVHALISIDRVTAARQGVDAAAEFTGDLETADQAPSDTERLALNQARIQAARHRRALASAEDMRESAFAALRGLLGLPAEQQIVLLGAPQTEIRQLPSAAELTSRALDRRSDVIAMRHAAEYANLRLGVTRLERIPNVTLTGEYGRFESDNFAGGTITVPVPIFLRKVPDVHEALAESERTSLQVQNLERTIAKDVIDARRACTVAGDDLHLQQQQILPLSEENLTIQRRLYARGKADAADVVNSQADLVSARQDYLDALETYNNALIELELVSGGSLSGG